MSLARNVAIVGTATMLSRLLGFARDVLIAAVFGAGSAGQTTVKTDRGQFAGALASYVAAPALLH